ncbi:MAG: hypothetical protein QM741_16235 [Rudaea sp.]|uniref:hypothetical protein n=1 Tax=Rudaea sp. TaxID=2136325 RepID=UPI0039E3AAD7
MKNFAIFVALALASTSAVADSPAPTVTFRGTTYRLSRTSGNEYDFTPAEQTPPSADVLTLLVLSRIKDGEALADLANRTLSKLKDTKATIVRTNSVPASAQKPAEHFMAVVIPSPDALQFGASRYVLVGGEGVEMIYMHTIHGNAVGNEMSRWLDKNGADVEQKLMQLDASSMMPTTPAAAQAPADALPPGTIQKGSLANPKLISDAMQGVAGKAATLGCEKIDSRQPYVVAKPQGPAGAQVWREKWLVTCAGKTYPIDIRFNQSGADAADWTIE